MTRRSVLGAVVLAAVTSATVGAAGPAQAGAERYEVTITDLTPGQPLTPPVVATHRGGFHVFQVGQAASFGVKEIAENGNNAPLLDALDGSAKVSRSKQAGGGPLVPDGTPGSAMFPDSVTFTISATDGANYLSFVSMLICTNDGFTGADRLRLPNQVGAMVVHQTAGYDAGTEINTEDFADIVPPCQSLIGLSSGEAGTGTSNPALAEGGVIHHHPGIQGGEDLDPSVHGWTDPVAEIEIERIA
jgi:Spondin_N